VVPTPEATAGDLIGRGDELAGKRDLAGALEQYEQAVETDPASAEAVARASLALDQLGRRDEGVERLRRAADGRDWEAPGLVWLSRALTSLGETDSARQLARRATEQHPAAWVDDAFLATELARAWEALGDPERGLAVLDVAGAVVGADTGGRRARGNLLAGLGRHEEALSEYDAALAIEPDTEAELLLDTADAAHALHRDEDALARARRARRAGGLTVWTRFRLVDLLDQLGAKADAGQVLDDFVGSDDWKPDLGAAVALAVRLYAKERYKDAAVVLDHALADPTWAASDDANDAITWRALSRHLAGWSDKAVEDFDALDARGARVTRPWMRAFAGAAYLSTGRRDTALAYLDGIADAVPETRKLEVLLHTGIALAQLGRTDEAIGPLRQARDLALAAPRDAPDAAGTAALFLAMAVANQDRDEQARLLEEADRILPADNLEGRGLLRLQQAYRATNEKRWDDVVAVTDGLAERLVPSDRPVAHLVRGRALAECSRLDEALAELTEALSATDLEPEFRSNVLRLRGLVQGAHDDHALARDDFVDALALSGEAAKRRMLRILIAAEHARLGEHVAALAALDELETEDPEVLDTAEYWFRRTDVLASLGRGGELAAAARRLAMLDPSKRRYARWMELSAGFLHADWSSADAMNELAQDPPEDGDALDWVIAAVRPRLHGAGRCPGGAGPGCPAASPGGELPARAAGPDDDRHAPGRPRLVRRGRAARPGTGPHHAGPGPSPPRAGAARQRRQRAVGHRRVRVGCEDRCRPPGGHHRPAGGGRPRPSGAAVHPAG
jgi:tetratricopeptide (TPR) repeat protein